MHFDNEMERSVLAAMILAPEVIPNITNEITELDFYSSTNREIYRGILRLYDKANEINIVTLATETGHGIEVATLTDIIPSGANWAYYVAKVVNVSKARRFVEVVNTARSVTPENIDAKLNEIVSETTKIIESSGGGKIKSARDYIIPMIVEVERARDRQAEYSGYDTGLNNINKITDGLQSEYIIIGARASIGKTALGINIARSLVKKGIPTGYVSLEMSGTALMLRMLADMSNIQAGMIRGGFARGANEKKIANAGMQMGDWKLYILDDTRGQFEKIVSKIRFMVRCMGVKVIFIDHASLMKYADRKIPRFEQFAEMSNALQNLQRELNIPIIVLAQLTRDAEGKQPTIADLRESGAFEQDADQIWILHRDRAKSEDETAIPTELIVAKNRNGACGVAHILFQPQFIRFVDMEGR